MTRKDYRIIAAGLLDGEASSYCIQAVAIKLREANPNFDRKIFYGACLSGDKRDDFKLRMERFEAPDSALWEVLRND